ncbi:MAG: hypothetical protein AYL29_006060 [Candidatus Bathyarchaeota archaeon B24]|nr:MAG: hypothetical protein AYL29_006060 [Candidatus Bathyarchaeota archaeon B24]RLI24175.1 MAG: UPF0175 family protein [Candidatus Bathyarchaeota archaeon]
MVKVVSIEVPEEVNEWEVRVASAVELYRVGKVTLKQAADIAGVCVEDFMKLLSRRGVSVVNWSSEELRRELESLDRL